MAAVVEATFGERDTTGSAHADFSMAAHDIGALRMCAFCFLGNGGAASALTSVVGSSLGAFTNRIAVVDSGNNFRVEWWTKWCASAVSGEVVTVDGPNDNGYNRRSFVLHVITGSDADGATGTNTASDIDGSPADPTLSVTCAADGVALAGLIGRGSGDTVEDGNTTQLYSSGSWAGFDFGERTWGRAGTGGATQLASTGDDPLSWFMAGLEIKAAAGGGGGGPQMPPRMRISADLERYLKYANFIL